MGFCFCREFSLQKGRCGKPWKTHEKSCSEKDYPRDSWGIIGYLFHVVVSQWLTNELLPWPTKWNSRNLLSNLTVWHIMGSSNCRQRAAVVRSKYDQWPNRWRERRFNDWLELLIFNSFLLALKVPKSQHRKNWSGFFTVFGTAILQKRPSPSPPPVLSSSTLPGPYSSLRGTLSRGLPGSKRLLRTGRRSPSCCTRLPPVAQLNSSKIRWMFLYRLYRPWLWKKYLRLQVKIRKEPSNSCQASRKP